LDPFGRLLHKTWLLKRTVSPKISNLAIDALYKTAMACGALGGKLLGAGSSGFMLFYVPHAKQQAVKSALVNYLRVPFKFEREGSSIIFYTPSHDDSSSEYDKSGQLPFAAVR
jgi:D-glycero-alpha-D-manno-heptose-7-phosphate kinase